MFAPAEPGTYACDDSTSGSEVTFSFTQGGLPVFYNAAANDGACSITVSAGAAAVGDVLEGTFTATLVGATDAEHAVTNGSFAVERVQ